MVNIGKHELIVGNIGKDEKSWVNIGKQARVNCVKQLKTSKVWKIR